METEKNNEKKIDTTAKTMAILGIICGGIAFIFYPVYFGPIGLILGIVALLKGEKQLGWNAVGLSLGGLVMGYVLGFLVSIN